MKDFFIKIRHFKEASSKSSENPQWASVLCWGGGLEQGLGFGKGAGTQDTGGRLIPNSMTQTHTLQV